MAVMLELHRAIAAHLVDVLGWRESGLLPALYPEAGGRVELAGTFAVLMPETVASQGRMRTHLAVATTVDVRFARTIQSGAKLESYERALAAEAQLVAALGSFRLRPTIERVSRSVIADGTVFLGTVRATVLHSIPIA